MAANVAEPSRTRIRNRFLIFMRCHEIGDLKRFETSARGKLFLCGFGRFS
jgi:hypothetical protein